MGLIADEHPAISYTLDAAGYSHGKGMQSYLTMMAVRLLEMRRVLKESGSIYLHCDPTASHYLKQLMDAVFGTRNFLNEVVWYYRGAGIPKATRAKRHDIILWFAKQSEGHYFNPDPIRRPYAKATQERFKHYIGNVRQDRDYGQQELNPKGKHPDDVIDHIQPIAPSAKERVGYPTQKPLGLLKNLISSSSKEGDVVLDPFAGCATACVAAEKLGRRWVGIDLSPMAYRLVQERLAREVQVGSEESPRLTGWKVTHRTDIPRRTDIDAPIHYRKNKHVLFGQQEGRCGGCRMDFPFKIFEVDHLVPQSRGGQDDIDNLQLLCSHCNRIKGDREQSYLIARLKETVYAEA